MRVTRGTNKKPKLVKRSLMAAARMEDDEPAQSGGSRKEREEEGGGGAAGGSGSAPMVADPADQPWVEKYRPRKLDDVVGNEPIVERLRAIAEDGNMNNMILAGPPGTGKTTSIHCLARALLGSAYQSAVLEMNASDDRGIDVVRNTIKDFARRKVTLPPGRHKIVILDEADSMTAAAQQALRRTMEIHSNTTRFALACNNSTKIIEPIQSRCAVLRYARLTDEEILRRLVEVCEAEHVPYDDKGLEAILFTAEGDMRHALNNLQSSFAGFSYVNEENVFKVCDQPHPMTVRAMLDACVEAKVETALQSLQGLWAEGYSALDIVGTVFRVTRSYNMQESLLLQYLREIGFAHMRVADGVASLLQLQGLVSRLCRLSLEAGVARV